MSMIPYRTQLKSVNTRIDEYVALHTITRDDLVISVPIPILQRLTKMAAFIPPGVFSGDTGKIKTLCGVDIIPGPEAGDIITVHAIGWRERSIPPLFTKFEL